MLVCSMTASKALLYEACQVLLYAAPRYQAKAMLDAQELAAMLRTDLKASGMTNAEFARKVGESRQSVGSWLKTGRVRKGKLPRIAVVLGVPFLKFFGVESEVNQLTMSDLCAAYELSIDEINVALSVASRGKHGEKPAVKAKPKKGGVIPRGQKLTRLTKG
jgi:transcriptional regulator with XRE-family HTH domain